MPAGPNQIDVLVIGAGVCGLWTGASLARAGHSCLVVEHRALGAGQTIASQGIIHGGIKYALSGAASRASRAIAEMPAIWEACLRGQGEPNLRDVRVLSDHQLLWTTAGIGSRLAGLAASKVIRTGVERVPEADRPAALREAPRAVDVYRVAEAVLDPSSLVRALAAAVEHSGGAILRIAGLQWPQASGGESTVRLLHPAGGEPLSVQPRRIVLAAGEGNASLLDHLGLASAGDRPPESERLTTQRRPLHMAIARGDLPPVFGHCVGLSDTPRITITTQRDGTAPGRAVWYIGGQVAEEGVSRDRAEQIRAAQRDVGACLPWIRLAGTEWSTFRIDRAEGVIGGRSGTGTARPDEPVVWSQGQVIAVWPTKLAFAPEAAQRVAAHLKQSGVSPSGGPTPRPESWPRPDAALLPWELPDAQWSAE